MIAQVISRRPIGLPARHATGVLRELGAVVSACRMVSITVSLHGARLGPLRTKPTGVRSGAEPRGRPGGNAQVLLIGAIGVPAWLLFRFRLQGSAARVVQRHGVRNHHPKRRNKHGLFLFYGRAVPCRHADRPARKNLRTHAGQHSFRFVSHRSERRSVSLERKRVACRSATRRSQPSETPKQTRLFLVYSRAVPCRHADRPGEGKALMFAVLSGVVRERGAGGGERDVAARSVPMETSGWEGGAAFYGV